VSQPSSKTTSLTSFGGGWTAAKSASTSTVIGQKLQFGNNWVFKNDSF
jgi:hypothetical protein